MNWTLFWSQGFTPLATFVAATVLCYSYRQNRSGRLHRAFLGLYVAALLLRLTSSTYFALAPWDERYHAVVASHMIKEPLKPTLYRDPVMPYDIRAWTGNHVWLHKPPLTMGLMALSLKTFGHHEMAVRVPSAVLCSFEPVMIALLTSSFLGPAAGWFAGFLNAINGYLIELASGRVATDHTDALMTFWVLLAVFCGIWAQRTRPIAGGILAGLAMGASILTKWWTGLIALPVVFLYDWGDRGLRSAIVRATAMLSMALTVVAPWEFHIRAHYPEEVHVATREHFAHFTDSLAGGPAGEYWLHFKNLPKIYGIMIIGAIVLFIARWIRFRSDRGQFLKGSSIFVWWIVPYVVFSIAETKMSGLVMVSSGALFVMAAFFREELIRWWERARTKTGNAILGVLAIGLVWGAPIQYGLERMKVFKAHDRFPVSAYRLRVLACMLSANQKTVIFNLPELIEAMFYMPHSAYGYVPTEAEVRSLKEKGYRVVGVFDTNAPVAGRSDIEWVTLPDRIPTKLSETLNPCRGS